MTAVCLKAAEILKKNGNISCEVIDARIIRPMSSESIDVYRSSAFRTGCILAVEDNVTAGGYGSAVEEIFAADEKVKVYKAGWPDMFIAQGTQAELEHRYGLDAEGIADRVRNIIERKA